MPDPLPLLTFTYNGVEYPLECPGALAFQNDRRPEPHDLTSMDERGWSVCSRCGFVLDSALRVKYHAVLLERARKNAGPAPEPEPMPEDKPLSSAWSARQRATVLWAHLTSEHGTRYSPEADFDALHEEEHNRASWDLWRPHPREERDYDLVRMASVLGRITDGPELSEN